MVFNSFDFLLFFLAFLPLYWLAGRHSLRAQNTLAVVFSLYFYAYWDWRYLFLLTIASLIDFYAGIAIYKEQDDRIRKRWLALSMTANLVLLGFFKYFNFFLQSTVDLLSAFGLHANVPVLQILLPVGISFYTFHSMSYTIDIYRRKLIPTDSVLDFYLFISFFPQLVAGPIARARSLLPQLQVPRKWDPALARTGVHLIVWGLWKKVFVADNLSAIVNPLFAHDAPTPTGLNLWIAMYAFAFQIYGDFSGYTDMARGLGRLLGVELILNFNLPYFARNPSDFWKRWHISLSGWLQEYLYISLGGSKEGRWKTYRNLVLTMLLGGLWHGAAWNFVIWGAYHGTLLVIWHWIEERWGKVKVWFPGPAAVATIVMLQLTIFGWLTFRATSAHQIVQYAGLMLTDLRPTSETLSMLGTFVEFSWFLILVQCFQFASGDLLCMRRLPAPLKVLFYAYVGLGIFQTFGTEPVEFIYFQF